MLKPRYGSIKEALADFKGSLERMEKRYEYGAGTILDRAEDVMEAQEEINDKKQAAKKKAERLEEARASAPAKARVLAENGPGNRYTSRRSAMDSFRVLAGLEERPAVPWDAGIVGSTKKNIQIMEEAGVLENVMSGEDGHHASAENLHRHVLAKHLAAHDSLHELPPEHQGHTLNKMGHERAQVAVVLKKVADDAAAKGLTKVADRLMQLVHKHASAADSYTSGQLPEPDEEDESINGNSENPC